MCLLQAPGQERSGKPTEDSALVTDHADEASDGLLTTRVAPPSASSNRGIGIYQIRHVSSRLSVRRCRDPFSGGPTRNLAGPPEKPFTIGRCSLVV
jgi:hypothetical protein